jgi:two-component system heavy metal sensor histidine kinase CusS
MLWRLSRMLLSPLRSVANAARLIAQGRLDKRIRTAHLPEGELLDIAEVLNASFDRYQEAIDRISSFSSAASHQLRTPLTAIRTTAELALAQPQQQRDCQQALAGILDETAHLSRMTEQLLLLSRMEAEHLREAFRAVDLNDAIRRVVELYQPIIESSGLRVDLRLAKACPVLGDMDLLLEAVTNLFDNAVKWTPAGGAISVSTSCENNESRFSIADEGPGIDASFRKNLFDRFTRHPAAAYKGTGLGLSIVGEVVRLHDGRIELAPPGGRGAEFRVTFPSANLTAS